VHDIGCVFELRNILHYDTGIVFWKPDTSNLVHVVGMGFRDSRVHDLYVPVGSVFQKNGTCIPVQDVDNDFRAKQHHAAGRPLVELP
jgi:hypothetical protein